MHPGKRLKFLCEQAAFTFRLTICLGFAFLQLNASAETFDCFPADTANYSELLDKAGVYPDSFFKHCQYEDVLFGVDVRSAVIVRLDKNLNKSLEFGGRGQGPGELSFVRDVAAGQKHIYVLDGNRVHIFLLNGRFQNSISLDGITNRLAAIAVDEEETRLLLLGVFSPQLTVLDLETQKPVLQVDLPVFREANSTRNYRLDRSVGAFWKDYILVARMSFPELLVYSRAGKLLHTMPLIPDRTNVAQRLSSYLETALDVGPDEPLPMIMRQLHTTKNGVDALTGGYIARVNLETWTVNYFLLYQPVSEHSRPDMLKDNVVKNGHYPGLVLSGGWWVDSLFIGVMSGEHCHAYKLTAAQ